MTKIVKSYYKSLLKSIYFGEIKIFLLKVLYINVKINWNSTVKFINSTKNVVKFINSSKNKLNSIINWQNLFTQLNLGHGEEDQNFDIR